MNNTQATVPHSATPHGSITFSRTVARHLVHRAALNEVFLTDMVTLDEHEFVCGAQLPRQHGYFSDTICKPPIFDAVLLMEAVRQAAFVGAHEQFAVPTEHKFILPGISLQIDAPDALRCGDRPMDMSILAEVTNTRFKDGECTGLDYEMELGVDGYTVARAATGMRMRSPVAYERMRAEHRTGRDLLAERTPRPLPVSAVRVGRDDDSNVVLGDVAVGSAGASATVLVPLDHPSMFDHPQDHIPGMVLVEAGRQLALLAASECCGLSPAKSYLAHWSATFTRFGELEMPAVVTATAQRPVIDQTGNARVPVSLNFSQDIGVICTATAIIATHPILPPVPSANDPARS